MFSVEVRLTSLPRDVYCVIHNTVGRSKVGRDDIMVESGRDMSDRYTAPPDLTTIGCDAKAGSHLTGVSPDLDRVRGMNARSRGQRSLA